MTKEHIEIKEVTFDEIWANKVKREGANPRNSALKAFNARVKEGVSPEKMLSGLLRYKNYCDLKRKTGTEFVQRLSTFLGPDYHFENDWAVNNQSTGLTVRTVDEQLVDFGWAK